MRVDDCFIYIVLFALYCYNGQLLHCQTSLFQILQLSFRVEYNIPYRVELSFLAVYSTWQGR